MDGEADSVPRAPPSTPIYTAFPTIQLCVDLMTKMLAMVKDAPFPKSEADLNPFTGAFGPSFVCTYGQALELLERGLFDARKISSKFGEWCG